MAIDPRQTHEHDWMRSIVVGHVVRVWRILQQQFPLLEANPDDERVGVRRVMLRQARHEHAAQLEYRRSVVLRRGFDIWQCQSYRLHRFETARPFLPPWVRPTFHRHKCYSARRMQQEEVDVARALRSDFLVAAIVCGLVVAGLAVDPIGYAQQPASPQAPATGIPAEAPGFVGKTARLDTTGYTIGRRVFAPGSRNATWHMHTAGQLIFAESGRGRYQIKGQPIRELAPGDSGFIPAGVMHWHGSTPNDTFTMAFINMGESTTSQGEPLTEDVYLGKK
jgi:quercetin dioxygenase-like cupin family protein